MVPDKLPSVAIHPVNTCAQAGWESARARV